MGINIGVFSIGIAVGSKGGENGKGGKVRKGLKENRKVGLAGKRC